MGRITNEDEEPLLSLDLTPHSPPYHTKNPGKASIAASVFNLAHTVLGAGILALPSTMRDAGPVLACILILFGAAGAGLGLLLLARCSLRVSEHPSYYTLAQASLARSGVIVDTAVALKCFGVACSYMLVIGQLFPDACRYWNTHPVLEDRHFWQSMFMIVILPLSVISELRKMRHVSLAALIAILFLAIFVAVYFFANVRSLPPDTTPDFSQSSNIFLVLPTVVFSFTCHQNMPSIVAEMSDASTAAVVKVIVFSLLSCFVILTSTAIMGFLTFGSAITSNVIDNYPVHDLGANMVRVAVGLSCMACIPFQIHPARTSVCNLLQALFPRLGDRPVVLRVAVGLALSTAMYLVAFFFTDLGLLFAVVGASGSTLVCYALPSFFYTMMMRGYGWPPLRIAALLLGLASVPLMVCGLAAVFDSSGS